MLVEESWKKVEEFIETSIGKIPQDLKGYLFLIGVQTLGKGPKNFTREEKQDLIHIAICEIFTLKGYYQLDYKDDQGWPHYKIINKIPHEKLFGQEAIIKEQIITYFESQEYI